MSTTTVIVFTALSASCSIILTISLIHYLLRVWRKHKKSKPVDPLVKKCATISLFGYTVFVLISFILDLISSLYYIPSFSIKYTKILCQVQTFNIVFFMTVCNTPYIVISPYIYPHLELRINNNFQVHTNNC